MNFGSVDTWSDVEALAEKTQQPTFLIASVVEFPVTVEVPTTLEEAYTNYCEAATRHYPESQQAYKTLVVLRQVLTRTVSESELGVDACDAILDVCRWIPGYACPEGLRRTVLCTRLGLMADVREQV